MTTSADLASEVTGSLSSASSLANNLGKWLALAVLIAAFLLASLLTMAAVSRRVREFGTLKALGWKSRRIIGQVMGETVALGILGGVVGIGLGFAGAELVSKLSPKLSAVGRPDHRLGHPGRLPPVRLRRHRRRHSRRGHGYRRSRRRGLPRRRGLQPGREPGQPHGRRPPGRLGQHRA